MEMRYTGSCGGNGGSYFDFYCPHSSYALSAVIIRSGLLVDSVQFIFTN